MVATSGANNCQYCVVAHGAILRVRAKNPLLADQVATNYRKADITPRQKAMLDFALQVALASGRERSRSLGAVTGRLFTAGEDSANQPSKDQNDSDGNKKENSRPSYPAADRVAKRSGRTPADLPYKNRRDD